MSDVPDEPSTLRGRTRALAIVVGVAVMASVLGFLASTWVRSPGDVAARTRPPARSVITAEVERRVVADTLVTRGTVGSLSTVPGVPTSSPGGASKAVITKAPVKAGSRLAPGDVVVEISGRPVLFMPGLLPAYRNLAPGMTGPDVTQLQEALGDAGFAIPADEQGRYGPGTAQAVAGLYRERGYEPEPRAAFPMSAVAYVNTPRSTVVVAKARLGQPAEEADIQLASSDLIVFVEASSADSQLIAKGTAVSLTAEVIDKTASGTVTQTPAQGEAGRVVIKPDSALAPAWAGLDIRVDVARSETKGEVLAVPAPAIALDAAGDPTIMLLGPDGERNTKTVEVGAVGNGFVEVSVIDGEIEPGDLVVVGWR